MPKIFTTIETVQEFEEPSPGEVKGVVPPSETKSNDASIFVSIVSYRGRLDPEMLYSISAIETFTHSLSHQTAKDVAKLSNLSLRIQNTRRRWLLELSSRALLKMPSALMNTASHMVRIPFVNVSYEMIPAHSWLSSVRHNGLHTHRRFCSCKEAR